MRTIGLILAIALTLSCGNKNDSADDSEKVAKKESPGGDIVSDPASQALMLEAAIEKKTAERESQPPDSIDERKRLDFEIELLEKNLERVRAKLERGR